MSPPPPGPASGTSWLNNQWIAAGVGAVLLVTGGLLAWGLTNIDTVISSWPWWKHAEVTISKPAVADSPTICYTIEGDATLKKGQALAVGLRERAENRWYFEGRVVVQQDGHWVLSTRLGDIKDKTARTYDIIAMILPKEEVNYMMSTNRMQDANHQPLTFWSSPDLPPFEIAHDQVTRQRQGVAGGKC